MKKALAILFSVFLFFIVSISIIALENSIILQCPNQEWKEIFRLVTPDDALVTSIPKEQTQENWTEQLSVQFVKKRSDESLTTIVEAIRKQTSLKHDMRWNDVDKHENDMLFECIVPASSRTLSPRHEIIRGFMTSAGYYGIVITHRGDEMKSEERDHWIKLLREKVSIVSLEKAGQLEGFSFAESVH